MDLQVGNKLSFQALKIKNMSRWAANDPATLDKFLNNENVQAFSKKYDVEADYYIKKERVLCEDGYKAVIGMSVKPLNAGFFTKAGKMALEDRFHGDTTSEAIYDLRRCIDDLDSVTLQNKFFRTDAGKRESQKRTENEAKAKLKEINED